MFDRDLKWEKSRDNNSRKIIDKDFIRIKSVSWFFLSIIQYIVKIEKPEMLYIYIYIYIYIEAPFLKWKEIGKGES